MFAVYYDLETTDKNTIGQIINYSFMLVNSELEVIDELSGLVKISRLQIPDPGAILANRTDVLEHQIKAEDTEPVAMRRIADFLAQSIKEASGAVTLIGYNSSRFDLGYLRTSLIRNGINPYFGGKLVPRDLLHVVQKAYLTHGEFRELVRRQREGEPKLSLSLQTVSHALGLLDGVQAHESREDVLLTIRLARWLRDSCDLDAASFEAYEGTKLHSTARSGTVYMVEEPEYDMHSPTYLSKRPVTLLDADYKSALWIDLERYASVPEPTCISWRSAAKNAFFISPQAVSNSEWAEVARSALRQFRGVTLKNFFEKSTCDIEQDIYRLDFDHLDLYSKALATHDKAVLRECRLPEAKVLWLRHQLASPNASLSDPATSELLKKYALYRYGGKLQVARTVREGSESESYHSTLSEMVRRLIQAQEAAAVSRNTTDRKLMTSLERFIRDSDILKVAGKELVPMWYSAVIGK
jgi:hypothetical protein